MSKYDPDINNIKVYGILDESGKCKDPYFLLKDVCEYLKGNTDKKYKKEVNRFKKNSMSLKK